MKIALLGYGNMGQEIARLAEHDKQFDIVSISYQNKNGLDLSGIKRADVAIDFTSSEVVMENIHAVAKLGINIVVGTTGWYDEMGKVKELITKNKVGLIYGQNFSIGAHLFFKIVAYAASLFDAYEHYDVYGLEVHHRGKQDSPSGTARKLSDIVLTNISRKTSLQTTRLDRQIKENEFHFASVRGGTNFGRHTITFNSSADEISLTHQAFGRQGFAEGALVAAEFINNKKGLYSFDDLFAKEVER